MDLVKFIDAHGGKLGEFRLLPTHGPCTARHGVGAHAVPPTIECNPDREEVGAPVPRRIHRRFRHAWTMLRGHFLSARSRAVFAPL
jgi:hypothetical protein